jgi:hypothetical protein
MGQALKATLEKSGYKVDLIKGARSLDKFLGIAPDGADVAVNLSKYSLGVIAGGLEGKITGMQVAERLSREKITTIGLSTADAMGEAFRLHGASIVTNKAKWICP